MTQTHRPVEQRCKKIFNASQKHQRQRDVLRQTVTDHAVVRYLEQVLGINTRKIREDIIGDKLKTVQVLKKCRLKNDGLILVVNNGVVVTVLLETHGL